MRVDQRFRNELIEKLTMQIRFQCPTEGCVALIEYEPLESCGGEIVCPRCKVKHKIDIDPSIHERGVVDQCAVCGCRELFIRKDFPQRLGLVIVLVFGITAVYLFSLNLVMAWLVLGTAVLLDLLIYALICKVTSCYACRAEYRKCPLNQTHEGFDLATSEKY